jgi:hypothetical protein
MVGYVLGGVALAVLLVVGARRRHHGWHRHGHGHGRRFFARRVLYRVLRRLDATPAQERLVRDEVFGVVDSVKGLRDKAKAARTALAAALRDETLDSQKLAAVMREQEELVTTVRDRVVEALTRVHASLDGRQRQELADAFERGYARGC